MKKSFYISFLVEALFLSAVISLCLTGVYKLCHFDCGICYKTIFFVAFVITFPFVCIDSIVFKIVTKVTHENEAVLNEECPTGLNDFEEELSRMLDFYGEDPERMKDSVIGKWSPILLQLARKQLDAELPRWKKCAVHPSHPGVLSVHVGCHERNGYEINMEVVFNK